MSRRRGRGGHRFEKLLLVVGILAVAIWAGSIAFVKVSQDWSNWVFEQRLRSQPVSVSEYLKLRLGPKPATGPTVVANPPAPEQPAPPAEKLPALKTGELLGRLAIPRLKFHAIVREGAGATTLDQALGHIPGTAIPGQTGNVGVAGHRDSLFRGLGQIRKADRIEFQTLHGNYEYEVESTTIVTPKTVEVLNPGPHPEITLVTCYPFHYVGSAPDRFIVKARLVTPNEISQDQNQAPQNQAGQKAQTVAAAAPSKPAPGRELGKIRPSARKIFFSLGEGRSRTLAPGISIGLESSDAASQRMNGWMWVMPDRRTIWLSGQNTREPLIFYGHQDGKRRELVITRIGRNSVSGYLQLPGA